MRRLVRSPMRRPVRRSSAGRYAGRCASADASRERILSETPHRAPLSSATARNRQEARGQAQDGRVALLPASCQSIARCSEKAFSHVSHRSESFESRRPWPAGGSYDTGNLPCLAISIARGDATRLALPPLGQGRGLSTRDSEDLMPLSTCRFHPNGRGPHAWPTGARIPALGLARLCRCTRMAPILSCRVCHLG